MNADHAAFLLLLAVHGSSLETGAGHIYVRFDGAEAP